VHLRADDRGDNPRDWKEDVGAEGNETGEEGDQIGEDGRMIYKKGVGGGILYCTTVVQQ